MYLCIYVSVCLSSLLLCLPSLSHFSPFPSLSLLSINILYLYLLSILLILYYPSLWIALYGYSTCIYVCAYVCMCLCVSVSLSLLSLYMYAYVLIYGILIGFLCSLYLSILISDISLCILIRVCTTGGM